MNKQGHPISLTRFLDRFTLIVGDVNTGKTTLTQRILDACCRDAGSDAVVVDLAPDIPLAVLQDGSGAIGGTLRVQETDRVRYFHCPIHAPRLQGKTERETLNLAAENMERIESLFEKALSRKTDVLFVNDCSLYLHAGRVETLISWIRSVKTAVVNGYYGNTLGPGLLSVREREGMEELINRCDRMIRLSGDELP